LIQRSGSRQCSAGARLDVTKPLDYHADHSRRDAGVPALRIVHYHHSEVMPLYLLTVYGKNEQANLGKAGRNELAKLVAILKSTAGN
jgi:hypothetical protein